MRPGAESWVAGWLAIGGEPRPWLLTRNGEDWTDVPLAATVPGRATVTDVTFVAANDGWVVGYIERPAAGYAPFLQHWNGTSWSAETLPWPSSASIALSAVSRGGDATLAVVGSRLDQDGHTGIEARRKNGVWRIRVEKGGPGSLMTDVAPLSNGNVAVGVANEKAATLVTCGTWPAATLMDDGGVFPTNPGISDDSGASGSQEVVVSSVISSGPSDTTTAENISGLVAIDRTSAAGLTMSMSTYEGVVGDFNADGYPDIFVNRHISDVPLLLLGSSSGTFTPAPASWTFRDRHGCAAADFNRNSALDLMCVVGANMGTRMNPNELLLGVGSTGGTTATEDFGLLDSYGRGRELAVLNYNRDTYPDLYVTNEPERIDGLPSSNRLYRNVGGSSLQPVPAAGIDTSMGGTCAVAADLDGDMDDDLLLCVSAPTNGVQAGARVFMNEAGTFVDRTATLGVTPMNDEQLAVADFNGDGTLDIAQLRTNLLKISAGGMGGFSSIFELALKRGVAMAVGDVDMNGKPDLYIVQRTMSNRDHLMLVNDGDGSSFTSMLIPEPGAGSADSVLAVDYDHNGRTDFVLLNGRYTPGPIKLTAFYPQQP